MLEEHETTVALVGEEIKCGLRLIAMVDRPAAFPGSSGGQGPSRRWNLGAERPVRAMHLVFRSFRLVTQSRYAEYG